MSLIRINVDGEVDTSNIDKLLSLLVNYSITIKSGEETWQPRQQQLQLQKAKASSERKRKTQSDSSVMNSLIQIQNLKQRGMSSKEAGKELGYSEPSVSLILTTQKIIDMFEKIAPSVRDKEYEKMLKELKVRLDIKPRRYNQISLGHIGTLRFLITYSHILSVDRRVEILRKLLGWNTPQRETMSADILLEYIKTIEASMNKIS
jgi:hypothetical protein